MCIRCDESALGKLFHSFLHDWFLVFRVEFRVCCKIPARSGSARSFDELGIWISEGSTRADSQFSGVESIGPQGTCQKSCMQGPSAHHLDVRLGADMLPGCSARGRNLLGKGQMGSALMGSLQISCFLTGTFWVLPLTYCYLPKSARVHLFPQSVKFINDFCSGPTSVDPICPQSMQEQ